jgi:tRNA1(Val) A37 N6-methylase TrmN6
MVDESLTAHLTAALARLGVDGAAAESGLEVLFAYTDQPHSFKEREIDALLEAIHTAKILDPACGSGAFPMGMLQKLVHIIHKLDPENAKWKQLQIDTAAQIPDSSARDAAIAAIERDFTENEDDYGRKLYLIENCLYGVDIQPIAIQISKLRFFISLICDQRTSRSKKDNLGIRPLPNLETKFVAADFLIALKFDPQQELFTSGAVKKLIAELKRVRHDHFAATTRQRKLTLQKRDKELREELQKNLAGWDPYDPQQSAPYFEPLWMFDPSLSAGFDIVIGNPPYQSAIEHKKLFGDAYRNRVKSLYRSTTGTWDLYVPFFERGLRELKANGILCYISPNKFLSATYGIGLRSYLLTSCRIHSLADVSHLPVFESASVYPVVSAFEKGGAKEPYSLSLYLPRSRQSLFIPEEYSRSSQCSDALKLLPDNLWGFLLSPSLSVLTQLIDGCDTLEAVARVSATTTAAEADALGATLTSAPNGKWKVLNTGTIDPFTNYWESQAIRHQGSSISRPMLPDGNVVSRNRRDLYFAPKIIFAKMALALEGFVDTKGEYAALNCNCAAHPRRGWTLEALAVVLHSSVVGFAYKQYFDGLRMSGGYLPFQAPQLRIVPIPRVPAGAVSVLTGLGSIRSFLPVFDSPATASFVIDLCDACVLECYFRDHMAERDLLFHEDLQPYLSKIDPSASQANQASFIEHLYRTLNAADSKIRNRLLRLTADSPDLLAVIKEEGRA